MNAERVIIQREMFLLAAPETVFGFLIDPAFMAKWIGLSHVLDPRPGGVFQVEVSRQTFAYGIYKEVIPYRRVVFTWGWESEDSLLSALAPGSSVVEFDLEPNDRGTLLHFRHSGLPKDLEQRHDQRWAHYLERLRVAIVAMDDGPGA